MAAQVAQLTANNRTIIELQTQVSSLESCVSSVHQEIAGSREALKATQMQLQSVERELAVTRTNCAQSEHALHDSSKKLSRTETALAEQHVQIADLEKRLSVSNSLIATLRAAQSDSDAVAKSRQFELSMRLEEVSELKARLQALETSLLIVTARADELAKGVDIKASQLSQASAQLVQLNADVAARDCLLSERDGVIVSLREEVSPLQICEQQTALSLKAAEAERTKMLTQLESLRGEVSLLQQSIQDARRRTSSLFQLVVNYVTSTASHSDADDTKTADSQAERGVHDGVARALHQAKHALSALFSSNTNLFSPDFELVCDTESADVLTTSTETLYALMSTGVWEALEPLLHRYRNAVICL